MQNKIDSNIASSGRAGIKPSMINKIQRVLRKQEVVEAFPGYVDDNTFDQWHLSLYRFATVRPLVYHRSQTISDALDFFNGDPALTLDAITTFQDELTHSILSLLRPGSSWEREGKLGLDTPQHLFDFDSIWHPEYQRYSEHVFNHLIRVPLYILGKQKGKDYINQDLSPRVDLLRNNGLMSLAEGFDSVVRNAISHGQARYGLYQITYVDKKDRQQSLGGSEFAQLFDDLVDTCHSILTALMLFIYAHKPLVQGRGVHHLPLGFRFMLVDALASNRRFQIVSVMESQAAKGNQLNIACRIHSRSRRIQILESIFACWHAANLGGQVYDRFAVSLDCGAPVPSSLFLDGQVIRQAIANNWTVEQCIDAKLLEAELLWYDSPQLRAKFDDRRILFSLLKSRMRRGVIQQWREAGFRMPGTRYEIRHVVNKSAQDFRRIEAYVIFHDRGSIQDTDLQATVKHIIKRLKRHKIRLEDMGEEKGRPRRPVYVWLRLFMEDKRIRGLEASGGWKEGNLILTAEWFSRWKNNGVIFVKNPDSLIGRIRIKYNPYLIVVDEQDSAQ